jgi:hypothetical protein
MRAVGPATTLFRSPRWDCPFWALTSLRRHWRSPERRADDRGVDVEFAVADALRLDRLRRRFSTVLDCGLFHTFDRDERPEYVASLASVAEQNTNLYLLCFSDEGPDTGPHPVSQDELRAAFHPSTGWNIAAIEADRVQTRFHDDDGAPAWFATIKRL